MYMCSREINHKITKTREFYKLKLKFLHTIYIFVEFAEKILISLTIG